MSDEGKRYDPTPARRARARREGNVARSAELGSVAAFGAAILATAVVLPVSAGAAATALARVCGRAIASAAVLPPASGDVPFAFAAGASASLPIALTALVPPAAAAVAGAAVMLAQGGGLHVTGPRIELNRLNLFAGLGRMVGGEAAVGAARAVLAFAAALLATAPVLVELIGGATSSATPAATAALAGRAVLRAWLSAFAVGAAFALADHALARRRWLRGLRMSLDEIKREAKENEGDPQARARRKSAHRTFLRGAVARVREASFVVVNPEHVAVALRYDPPDVPVPTILVRALDEAALRVKTLARELAIPIVEDVALARSLYASGESGRPIPPDAYVAVAEVVAALARDGLLACDRG